MRRAVEIPEAFQILREEATAPGALRDLGLSSITALRYLSRCSEYILRTSVLQRMHNDVDAEGVGFLMKNSSKYS